MNGTPNTPEQQPPQETPQAPDSTIPNQSPNITTPSQEPPSMDRPLKKGK